MAAPQRSQRGNQSTSTSSSSPSSLLPSETRPLGGVEALAGAVANAFIQSFSSASQYLARDSSARTDTNTRPSSLATEPRIEEQHHSGENPVSTSPLVSASTYELASGMRRSVKRPRFEPPSLFESERRGRHRRNYSSTAAGNSKGLRRSTETVPKATQYSRNVILLPLRYKSSNGEVLIPRKGKRSFLGQAGLVGKIEILSTMTDLEVRREICEVFATPMGLTEDDLKSDRLFPFSYLQSSGTHSYCIPSVNKSKFEWNGKQVASLAKAGAYIYLLADAELPGYQALVSYL